MPILRFAGLRVDLFTPSIPFVQEARRTAVRLEGPNGPANFLSAEAIAVFKMLFFRPKDQLDVEKLLAVQGDSLDTGNIRRWLVDMMGADDERIVAFDAMLARRRDVTG